MTPLKCHASQGGSVDLYNTSKKFETTSSGVSVTSNVVVSGTVDGRDVATDGSKLDGCSWSTSDIVSDTSPQLGGTLNTNGNIIQFGDSGSATDDRLQFGLVMICRFITIGSLTLISPKVGLATKD